MKIIELFEAFEDITDQIIALDAKSVNVVSEVERCIEERQKLIEAIDALNEQAPNQLLNRILQKNLQAETKLEEIMLNIKQHIHVIVEEKKRSSVKKKANRSYMNIGHQVDGYFIDKKEISTKVIGLKGR